MRLALPRLLTPRLLTGAALSVILAGCANGPHARPSANSSAPAPDEPAYARAGANPNAPYSVLESQPKLLTRSAALTADLAQAEPCLPVQLAVFEVAANVDGNRRSVTLGFVNRGAAPCKIGGYPEIQLLDAHHQIMANVVIERVSATTLTAGVAPPAQPATAATPAAAEVFLAPHSEADFQIAWTTGDGCPEISQISVAAPGSHHLFILNRRIALCEGPIQITALQPGGAS